MTGEDELIRRAQTGDLEAFCRLAREYERRVYTLALHYCRDPADAEDLSQEVWLKVFKSLGGFRSESSFHTWLRRITVNTFLNHRRAMQLTREDGRAAIRLESIEELADEPALAESLSHGEAENGFHQRILL
ncbi:MAG TPA: sigma-70 family RNA polymerase sigma factor, partial [Pyrinomonadaceae bacterium]|nr:sigma-70 family RNA polymerase sigma factor [Pyrinomonadaceae bacterium]